MTGSELSFVSNFHKFSMEAPHLEVKAMSVWSKKDFRNKGELSWFGKENLEEKEWAMCVVCMCMCVSEKLWKGYVCLGISMILKAIVQEWHIALEMKR